MMVTMRGTLCVEGDGHPPYNTDFEVEITEEVADALRHGKHLELSVKPEPSVSDQSGVIVVDGGVVDPPRRFAAGGIFPSPPPAAGGITINMTPESLNQLPSASEASLRRVRAAGWTL